MPPIGTALCALNPTQAATGAPSHLHIMGFYGFDPDKQNGWTNLGMEGSASLKVYAKNK